MIRILKDVEVSGFDKMDEYNEVFNTYFDLNVI